MFEALPENGPVQRQPDIARARELLGWRPTVPLDVGLARTIEYFDGLLARGRGAFLELAGNR